MAKQRVRRGEAPLPAATVVIRGDLLDPDVLAESAQRNWSDRWHRAALVVVRIDQVDDDDQVHFVPVLGR